MKRLPRSLAWATGLSHAAAMSVYDQIGAGYTVHRREDPRIAAAIGQALGAARTVVNVGAGTGSYEPRHATVTAVEPSRVMIAQRPADAARAVNGRAEELPFSPGCFDAAMAVLTVHHWNDAAAGLREMARVASHVVAVVTWDPAHDSFWLLQDYFPELLAMDRRIFPPLEVFSKLLPRVTVTPLPVPHDCLDGFLGAWWQRPHAYLEDSVRGAISSFSRMPDVQTRLEPLRKDLASGLWHRTHGNLEGLNALDVGYRLVVSHLRAGG